MPTPAATVIAVATGWLSALLIIPAKPFPKLFAASLNDNLPSSLSFNPSLFLSTNSSVQTLSASDNQAEKLSGFTSFAELELKREF